MNSAEMSSKLLAQLRGHKFKQATSSRDMGLKGTKCCFMSGAHMFQYKHFGIHTKQAGHGYIIQG